MRVFWSVLCEAPQEVNTLRPGSQGLTLADHIQDAVRLAEMRDAYVKTILDCSVGEDGSALGSSPSVSADLMEQRAGIQAAGEENSHDKLSYGAVSVEACFPSKRLRADIAAKSHGVISSQARPPIAYGGRSSRLPKLDDVPELKGTPLSSPPLFLCSNTTLVICPPFLARHWEAQLEQWFGWHHLHPSERMKVGQALWRIHWHGCAIFLLI